MSSWENNNNNSFNGSSSIYGSNNNINAVYSRPTSSSSSSQSLLSLPQQTTYKSSGYNSNNNIYINQQQQHSPPPPHQSQLLPLSSSNTFKPLSPPSSSYHQTPTSPQSLFFNNNGNNSNNNSIDQSSGHIYINSPGGGNYSNDRSSFLESRSPITVSMNASPIHFNDPTFKVPVHLPLLSIITNSPSLNSSIDSKYNNSNNCNSSFNSTPTKQSNQFLNTSLNSGSPMSQQQQQQQHLYNSIYNNPQSSTTTKSNNPYNNFQSPQPHQPIIQQQHSPPSIPYNDQNLYLNRNGNNNNIPTTTSTTNKRQSKHSSPQNINNNVNSNRSTANNNGNSIINNSNTATTTTTTTTTTPKVSKTKSIPTIKSIINSQKDKEPNDLKLILKNSIYSSTNDLKELMNQPNIEYIDSEYPEIKGKYRILEKIGQGTFSGVYKSVCIDGPNIGLIVALKRVAPTSSPARILNEIHSLLRVGGHYNVSALLGALRYKDQVTLVLPYFEHDSFKDYFFQMTNENIKQYLYALFDSLRHIHKNNICHRDVKPTNFLYCLKKNSFLLIDFGLAQEMNSNDIAGGNSTLSNTTTASTNGNGSTTFNCKSSQEETIIIDTTGINGGISNTLTSSSSSSNKTKVGNGGAGGGGVTTKTTTTTTTTTQQQAPRAGTRGFRAPEVLLKYNKQTTAIDIWSVGVILLCMISGRYPFFISPDDMTSLAEIVSIIGSKKIIDIANLLEKKVTVSHTIQPTSWKDLSRKLRNESSEHKQDVPPELYDLLERCLDPNPQTRITASDALFHPFLNNGN